MRKIRLALLEANVNYRVVKEFIARIKERAIGSGCAGRLERHAARGEDRQRRTHRTAGRKRRYAGDGANVHRPCTCWSGCRAAAKPRRAGSSPPYIRKQGQRPLLVATDVARPAAIQQLQVVGKRCSVPVFQLGTKDLPVDIARAALVHAREQ